MRVTAWIFEPEEVKAAIELYMVEEQGAPLYRILSIEFLIIDKGKGPVFDGAQISFDDPGEYL